MRNRLWANSALSSPPTPPRISIMTLLLSFGSCGSRRIFSSCSSASLRFFASANSSWHSALSSASVWPLISSKASVMSCLARP